MGQKTVRPGAKKIRRTRCWGIFDIQMPLLYGEGRDKALKRIRDEIDKPLKDEHTNRLIVVSPTRTDWVDSTETRPKEAQCLQDLFITNRFKDKKKLQRKGGDRAEGTCEWFIRTEELTTWLEGQRVGRNERNVDILWLHGMPGKGKRTRSIFLGDKLTKRFSTTPDKPLVFFFCDSSFEGQRTASTILRGFLWQLVRQYRQLLRYVLPKYEERKAKLFHSFDALWTILMKVAADKSTGRKYCIVDALDECEVASQETLLKQLEDNFGFRSSESASNIRILIASRPYPETEEYLGAVQQQRPGFVQ